MILEKAIKEDFKWMKEMIRQGNHMAEDGLDLLEGRVISAVREYAEWQDRLALEGDRK